MNEPGVQVDLTTREWSDIEDILYHHAFEAWEAFIDATPEEYRAIPNRD